MYTYLFEIMWYITTINGSRRELNKKGITAGEGQTK